VEEEGGWKTVGKTDTTTPSTYSAPTAGLQKVLFSFGSTKDAAEFITTKSKLARFVGTQSWPGAAAASMAMEDMAEPILTPPIRPKLEQETIKQDGTTETITRPETSPMFKMEVEDYIAANKTYNSKKDKWEENRPRAYNLVLQHCPPELETRLTSQAKWEKVRADRDVVSLLKMIRDIAHNHDENKPGLMAIIECDLELSLGFQDKTQTCDDFMAVFKARVDTINAHRGKAGKHPGHLHDTFERIIFEKGVTMQAVVNWSEADQQALKEEVEAIANEEYLAVLFIKQADEFRYGELKTTLANAYLNPNSTDYGYPTTLQDALRLLKGYIRIRSN
jgi:hypothetical protein